MGRGQLALTASRTEFARQPVHLIRGAAIEARTACSVQRVARDPGSEMFLARLGLEVVVLAVQQSAGQAVMLAVGG
jgi:hypothetical protein